MNVTVMKLQEIRRKSVYLLVITAFSCQQQELINKRYTRVWAMGNCPLFGTIFSIAPFTQLFFHAWCLGEIVIVNLFDTLSFTIYIFALLFYCFGQGNDGYAVLWLLNDDNWMVRSPNYPAKRNTRKSNRYY